MPAQTGKAGGFDFDKSIKAHAGDETVQRKGFIDLPGGITGGVARLVEAKISKYESGDNKGKEFFYAAGVVVKPKKAVEIVKVWDEKTNKPKVVDTRELDIEGQRTSIMIQLCDRKNRDGTIKKADEFMSEVLNEVRLLGASTDGLEGKADFLALLEELKEAKPYFKFSTRAKEPTAQYPNSGTWPHTWQGVKGLEEFSEDEESDVDDQGSDEDEGTEEEEAEAEESNGDSDDDGGDEVGSAEESDEVDLDALAKAADKKGGGDAAVDAQEKLKEIATSAGVEDDAVENADDWKDVVRMIREAQEGGESSDEEETEEEEEAEEEENPAPQVGDPYGYQLIDPKTKKPLVDPKTKKTKKPIEVEVTKVDTKAQTVTVKNLEDDKVLKDPKTGKPLAISWDDLIRDL